MSNLPPGCSVRDIPGCNETEGEAFSCLLTEILQSLNISIDDDTFEKLDARLFAVMDETYRAGYDAAVVNEAMGRNLDEMDRQEQELKEYYAQQDANK